MSRIDLVVLGRIGSRILLSIAVIFGLIMMAESLNTGRLDYLTGIGGPQLAVLSLVASAGRWTIRTLSVTVLIGTIIGVLDLQAKHELTVIKASGYSIWRVMRAPALALIAGSLGVALFLEGYTAELDRSINPDSSSAQTGAINAAGELWLEQAGGDYAYVMLGGRVQPGGSVLNDVTVFVQQGGEFDRIVAPEARLREGEWFIASGTGYSGEGPAQPVEALGLPTAMTAADLRIRLASTDHLTFFELGEALATNLSDPLLHAAVATRFLRLLTLPVMLVGSLLIAFAFTAGYRRTHKYGIAVLYGIVLGFVVFLVTEMADRAGSAGVLDPTFAAVAPAFVAVLIGVTVLLYKEDGRA